MSDISEPLCRVLNVAAPRRDDDHRLVAYAANNDFWVDEIEHCLRALRGFESRQRAFSESLKAAIRSTRERTGYSNPTKLHYGEATTSTELESHAGDVAQLEEMIISAAKG